MDGRSWLFFAWLLLSGCEEGRLGDRASPIIGGEPATIDLDATVLLINVGGGFSSCSGSVISPRVVVTAKHGLGEDPTDPEAPLALNVMTRPSLDDDVRYDVVDGRTTPGFGNRSSNQRPRLYPKSSSAGITPVSPSKIALMPDPSPSPVADMNRAPVPDTFRRPPAA